MGISWKHFSEKPKVVKFLKCEPFNRNFSKFWYEIQLQQTFMVINHCRKFVHTLQGFLYFLSFHCEKWCFGNSGQSEFLIEGKAPRRDFLLYSLLFDLLWYGVHCLKNFI